MRSIAILNQKGGVGKTTTAVNLSAALAAAGHHVCLIDLDPQAHATLHLGQTPGHDALSIYQVLLGDASLAAARQRVDENLWLVGSHIDLAAAEVELAGVIGREVILHDKLVEMRNAKCEMRNEEAELAAIPRSEFRTPNSEGFVLIDCPPSLGILTLNALAAVDEVLLPLQPHFLALHGLSKLMQTIDLVSRRLNSRLKLTGVVLCQYESATRLAGEVSRDVAEFFDRQRARPSPWSAAHIFQTRIRRNIRLAEAPSFGRSIFAYAPDSPGAQDYRALAEELLHTAAQRPLAQSA
jgi:chromosome partitioning protein